MFAHLLAKIYLKHLIIQIRLHKLPPIEWRWASRCHGCLMWVTPIVEGGGQCRYAWVSSAYSWFSKS